MKIFLDTADIKRSAVPGGASSAASRRTDPVHRKSG
jgi:hypothetical protein